MWDIKTVLERYAADTENAETNFELAEAYAAQSQLAGAVSFYLRCAERTDSPLLAYSCLLKMADSFQLQGHRPRTVKGCYQQAICLMPARPEAYYLLGKWHRESEEYTDAYLMAKLGLQCEEPLMALPGGSKYPGKQGLLYLKSVAAWWWGRVNETRELHQELLNNYTHAMNKDMQKMFTKDLILVAGGPKHARKHIYNKTNLYKCRHLFPGIERIEHSYAQVLQDMFVLAVLNGKTKGRYLELGSSEPFENSNTALLETVFDWEGVSIDFDVKCVDAFKAARRNKVLLGDARTINYAQVLESLAPDGIIDYLQLDCDPASITFEVLLSLPLEKYKCAVITYEHDHYADVTRSYRDKSRKWLEHYGYQLIVPDVSFDGRSSFEDWWVHPDLVDQTTREKLTCKVAPQDIKDYFFNT